VSSDFHGATFGRWTSILAHWIDPKFLRVGVHQACPICGGKDRYNYKDNGVGQWYCNQCYKPPSKPDGITLLQLFKGWDFKQVVKEVEAVIGTCHKNEPRPEVDKKAILRKIYLETVPINGTPAEEYLRSRCTIIDMAWLHNLRYHHHMRCPASFFGDAQQDRYLQAMIAVCTGLDGKGCGIQATYLSSDGKKIYNRWNYGEIGCGVWIGPPECKEYLIAEGVETTISAIAKFGYCGWASLSAASMKSWAGDLTKIAVVAGDNDANFTGQAAAYTLANRVILKEGSCIVKIPEPEGKDWNDLDTARS
jgi:putative DNA primase/helicase